MKIEKINNNKQKLIIISLIVSDKFCDKIMPILKENKDLMFQTFSSFYKIVLFWIFEYFEKYQKAPHNHIQDIFNSKKQSIGDENIQLIEKFITHLSQKYERDQKYNEDYVIDESLKYLREVNLNILQKRINESKEKNRIDEAENHILKYSKLESQTEIRQETFLFRDVEKAIEVCDFQLNSNEGDRLFRLPGDLGKKLDWIYREDFFSIVGPAKRGKSYYLREIGVIASTLFNLNVILFNLEMNHKKYLRCFYQNIANEVKFSNEDEEKKIKIPCFDFDAASQKYNIKYNIIGKKGLTGKKIKSVIKRKRIIGKGDLLIRSFPSNTLTIQKINKVLDDYVLQGFVPDVVLFDFLDNIKVFEKSDHRHKIDMIWNNARRLAQEKHIAVGTVSHTSKKNFKTDLKQGDVNEDYRKENHITHMFGLNQTPDEKNQQITRINILHNRDEDFNPKQFFLTLECRDIGRVLIDNFDLRKINFKIKKEN